MLNFDPFLVKRSRERMSGTKFNQSIGRLQNTGERVVAVGSSQGGSVTHIPAYKPTGVNFGSSRIRLFQEQFKMGRGNAPVFARTPRDVLMYRGLMGLSLVGITLTLFGVGLMATGNMKKKN